MAKSYLTDPSLSRSSPGKLSVHPRRKDWSQYSTRHTTAESRKSTTEALNIFESFRIAVASLATNRLRAILTTLGIIIGVGAVIGLISLGRGVEKYVAGQFESLGSNVLFVFSSKPTSGTRTTVDPLTTVEGAALADPSITPAVLR